MDTELLQQQYIHRLYQLSDVALLQNFVATCMKYITFKNSLMKQKNSDLLPGYS
jgi:hypothetical protein